MAYKIAVLMGGSSFERDFSLASGRYVLKTLEREGHTVLPLDTSTSLVEVLRNERPDVAFIALHGGHGEDGTVQALLEYLGIPFVGSPASVCRSTWNKSVLPHVVSSYRRNRQGGGLGGAAIQGDGSDAAASSQGGGPSQAASAVSWPKSVCLSATSFKDFGAAGALDLLTERLGSNYPVAVLPACGGSAMGISKVEGFDDLASAILDALSFDDEVLVEEWLTGVELAVSVIGTGDAARVLPPVEICPHAGFFNTTVRLDPDLVDYYSPVRDTSLASSPSQAAEIRGIIEAAALEAHHSFGCRDLSRVDMFWDGRQVKLLEINVAPGMTEVSLLPTACKAANIPFGSLLNELLDMAVSR